MKIYFGLNVKHLRKTRNIEREDLASHFGLHLSSISHWETGKHLPKVEDVVRIAQFFDVSVDDLLLRKLEDNPNSVQEKSEPYLSVSEKNSHEIASLHKRMEEVEARLRALEGRQKD